MENPANEQIIIIIFVWLKIDLIVFAWEWMVNEFDDALHTLYNVCVHRLREIYK